MSRVGKHPVPIPDGVEVTLAGQTVTAKGKLGQRSITVNDEVALSMEDRQVWVKPRRDTPRGRTMWGTCRSLVNNLIVGVAEGFTVNLEIIGVGYRAAVAGKSLKLQLGFSHDIDYPIPDDIEITCERPTLLSVKGADKQRVGQVAADIRGFRPPEPYKGKGIRYVNEYVRRKEGKKK